MADPNDLQTETEVDTSKLSGADRRFLEQVGQSKGFVSHDQADVGETLVSQATKFTTIRRRFMTNILPILIIPMIILGLVAFLGLDLLGQRTTDAVDTTDDILIEHNANLAETMGVASDTGADVVNTFLIEWFARVQTIESSEIEATITARSIASFTLPASDSSTFGLATQTDIQVVYVNSDGSVIDSSHPETTLDSYADAEWLTIQQSFLPVANDAEHLPSLQFTRTLDDGSLVRVRIPFSNLQRELDRISAEESFDFVVIDNAANVTLADTLLELSLIHI